MAGNVANRTVRITYEFAQKNAQIAKNVNKLVKGTTHNFKGLSHQMQQTGTVMGRVVGSFKSFHMELLGLGFGFAMIGMIFSQFVTKALNEYLKLTKFGDALGMSWLNMQGAIRTLGYHIVSFAEDTLKGLFDGIDDTINKFMDFDASVGGAASSMLILVGAAALVLSPLAFFGLFLFSVGQLLIKTAEFAGFLAAAVGSGGLAASLGYAVTVLFGLASLLAGVVILFGGASKTLSKSEKKVDAISIAIALLNILLGALAAAVVLVGGAIVGFGYLIGAAIGSVIRVFWDFGQFVYDVMTQTIPSAIEVSIQSLGALYDAATGKISPAAAMKRISIATIGAAGVIQGLSNRWGDFVKKAETAGDHVFTMMNDMFGEESAFADMFRGSYKMFEQGLDTILGKTEKTTKRIADSTGEITLDMEELRRIAEQYGTETVTGGTPGGAPTTGGADILTPGQYKDFIAAGGITGTVDVNINIEKDVDSGISVHGEVLTSDEKMNATLNQAGVRA